MKVPTLVDHYNSNQQMHSTLLKLQQCEKTPTPT